MCLWLCGVAAVRGCRGAWLPRLSPGRGLGLFRRRVLVASGLRPRVLVLRRGQLGDRPRGGVLTLWGAEAVAPSAGVLGSVLGERVCALSVVCASFP